MILLLKWVNFNPGMEKLLQTFYNVGWNSFYTPKMQLCKR